MKDLMQDLIAMASCESVTTHDDCEKANKLGENETIQQLCLKGIGARLADPGELIHFFCHAIIESYVTGYQAKCRELDCRELESLVSDRKET